MVGKQIRGELLSSYRGVYMSNQTTLRRRLFGWSSTRAESWARPTVVRGTEAQREESLDGPVALLTSPRVPEPAPAPDAPDTSEVTGLATFGAARIDSTSFCLRVTVPRGAATVAPGYSFRLTLTRSAEAPAADVAVSDWLDLVVDQRASTGGRLAALPGDFAPIASGDTWTYDIRTTTALAGGVGRSMRFAESPTGRGWIATFVELDAGGDPIGAVHTHTF